MPGPRKFPPLDSLVSVDWVDITATINSDLSDASPCDCTTTGRLMKKTGDFIVIGTSLYREPGQDPSGDFVSIPLGVVKSCKRL